MSDENRITIIIEQMSGKRSKADIEKDMKVSEIIEDLKGKLHLAKCGPDKEPLIYELHTTNPGGQLLSNESLESAGIKSGDIIKILTTNIPGSPLIIVSSMPYKQRK